MVKSKGNSDKQPNKAAAIRDELAKDRRAPAKNVVAALAEKGIRVSEARVYMVRSQAQKKKQRARRAAAVEQSRRSGFRNPVEVVLKVRTLASELGGMKHLKALVDVLAE